MRMTYTQFGQDEKYASWVQIDQACYSDYGGSGAVGQANFLYLHTHYEDHKDLVFLYGSIGFGEGVAYNPNMGDTDLLELIDSLSDYPCFDDELHSQVLNEWIDDAWDNWIMTDFRDSLSFDDGQWVQENDDLTDKVFRLVFETVRQRNNVEYIPEYSGVYVDIDKVAENTTPDDFDLAAATVLAANL